MIANLGRNCIKMLRNEDGERIQDVAQLKDMLISYYQNLLGTQIVGVSPLSIDEIQDRVSFRCSTGLVLS